MKTVTEMRMLLHNRAAGLYASLIAICFYCSVVKSQVNPTFVNCPGQIDTKPDDGKNEATVFYAIPLANDAGDKPAAVTCVPISGSPFPGGTKQVTCTAVDTGDISKTATCTFDVNVYPTFEACPNIIEPPGGGGGANTVINYDLPKGATDSLKSAASVTCTPDTGTPFEDDKATPVTCTATDSGPGSRTAKCTFTVTVGTKPDFTAPESCDGTTLSFAPDKGETFRELTKGTDWTEPTSGASTSVTCEPAGAAATYEFPAGDTRVTCTVKVDAKPTLINSCFFDVKVYPVFEKGCPADMVVPKDAGVGTTTSVSYQVPSDVLDSAGNPQTATCSPASDTDFGNDKSTLVECGVMDSDSTSFPNPAKCEFYITVGDAPWFTTTPCLSDIEEEPDSGTTAATVSWNVPVSLSSTTVTCNPSSPATFDGGTTTVKCKAEDASMPAVIGACDFEVRVYPAFDKNECLKPITRSPDPGKNTATVAWLGPFATTKSNQAATVKCEPPSGSSFTGGEKPVKCTATQPPDVGEAVCTFDVNVYPTFDKVCPPDVSWPAAEGSTHTVVKFTEPTGSTDPDGTTFPVTCNPASGDSFENGKPTTVECTVKDPASELTATCQFSVTIAKGDATDCKGSAGNCVCDGSDCACKTGFSGPDCSVADGTECNSADSADCPTCSGDGTPCACITGKQGPKCDAVDHASSCTAVGVPEANCEKCVGSGGIPPCICKPAFKGVDCITEAVPPNLVTCVGDINEPVGYTGIFSTPTWGDLAITDDAGGVVTFEYNPKKETAFPLGEKKVTVSAIDARGNKATCQFTVNTQGDAVTCESTTGGCVCQGSECACKKGFSGPGCDDKDGDSCIDASKGCGADCPSSTCTCDEGWQGTNCLSVDNAVECTGVGEPLHCGKCLGTSDTPPCICEDGWLGTDCAAEYGDVIIVCPADNTNDAEPSKNTKNVVWDDPIAAYLSEEILCIPKSGTDFEFGTTTVVCTAFQVERRGTCSFDVTVTGSTCATLGCTGNSACALNDDGTAFCKCSDGYAGDPCTRIIACDSSPCHTNADCAEGTDPGTYICTCKEGYSGDGEFLCEAIVDFEDEFPDLPQSDLDKSFKVTITIETESANGCQPSDKHSRACVALVAAFRKLVEPLYRQVSPYFKSLIIVQSDIREGSIIIPHSVIYNYTGSVRSMGTEEFYGKSVKKGVEAGSIGSLKVANDTAPVTDTTNVCSTFTEDDIPCPGKMVPLKVTNDSACFWICTSQCKADDNYCNGGDCSQPGLDKDPKCSCPDDKGGVRCTEDDGPNIPLIVGLSVGLGGGALLIVLGVIIYLVCKKNSKVVRVDSASVEGSRSNVALTMSPKST